MSEEATVADSVSEPEVNEPIESGSESGGINIESVSDQIGADLFGKAMPEESEESDEQEVEATEEADAEEDTTDEPEPEVEKFERPASWKKDMQETWEAMTPEAQKYVLHREEQMKQGLAIDREDSNLGRSIRDVMNPYSQQLKQAGINEATAVKKLLDGHMTLVNANPEQRRAYFMKMAHDYGVSLGEPGEMPAADPKITMLEHQLQQLTGYISKQQQREVENTQNQIYTQVEEFASTHPHFDELAEPISKFIDAGFELEEAYQAAVRTSPVHFQKELDRIQQETAAKLKADAKKQAVKVKQATSVNVKNRDHGKAPTAPTGSMDDTLRETYREINRN